MHFEIQPDAKFSDVSVVYTTDEYSFGVRPESDRVPNTISSIMINNVQLQMDEHGRIFYVDGYCYHGRWLEADICPPPATRGALIVTGLQIAPGVSVRLTPVGAWPVSVNRKTGWVCIGEHQSKPSWQAVEFARGSIAALENGTLESVWLKPLQLP